MTTIANLDVNLNAKTSKYSNKMKGAGDSTRRFSKSTKNANQSSLTFSRGLKVAGGAATAFVAAAAAVAAGVNRMVQSYAALNDEIAKNAKKLQINSQEYQSLVFAIEQSGGTSNDFKTAIRSVTRNVFDLERGLSTAEDSFGALNISMSDLEGLSTADQFRLVTSRLQAMKDDSRRAAVAQKLLGRSGLELLPLLGNIDSLEGKFKELGLGVNENALAISEDLVDANNELDKSWQVLGAQITESFGPGISDLTRNFAELVKQIAKGLKAARQFGNELKGIPGIVEATGDFSEAEYQRFLRKRAKDKGLDFATGERQMRARSELPRFDRLIQNQKSLVETLRDQNTRLAPIPKALQKGTQAQFSFLRNLERQREQARINAREEKKVTLAEKRLEELKKLRKLQEKEEDKLEEEGVEIVTIN